MLGSQIATVFSGGGDSPAGILRNNLEYWYRPESAVLNGTAVIGQSDLSGKPQNNLTNGAGGSPTYLPTGGPNGLPAIQGDGVNDNLETTTFTRGTHAQDGYIVVRIDTFGSAKWVQYIEVPSVVGWGLVVVITPNRWELWDGGANIGTENPNEAAWYVIRLTSDAVATSKLYTAGETLTGTTAVAGNYSKLSLFSATNSSWCACTIAESFGKRGALSESERSRLRRYLSARYAIAEGSIP